MTKPKTTEEVRGRRTTWARVHRFLANRDMVLRHPKRALVLRCQLHLIDLKMAGHSPTRTEYSIPGGR